MLTLSYVYKIIVFFIKFEITCDVGNNYMCKNNNAAVHG